MRRGLGLDYADYLSRGVAAVEAAGKILGDPALPRVTSLVLELHSLEQPKTTTGAPRPSSEPGIGLKRVVKPLEAYVAIRRKPILGILLAGAVIGVPLALGYYLGKGRR